MVWQGAGAVPMVLGHDWAVNLLQQSLSRDRLAHAYLFTGPPSIGKTTLALYLARALNCTDPGPRPCGTCSSCRKIDHGVHPDVRVIDESEAVGGAADEPDEPGSRRKRGIKIGQIRELQTQAALSPFEGRRRVYVLCDFQQANLEAANCLLKTLEEPPNNVVLILTALQAEGLLPTIVSRCQVLNLRPMPVGEVQKALQQYWGIEERRAAVLASLSAGRIGWAIRASQDEALMGTREKYLVALEQSGKLSYTERIGLAQQLGRNPANLMDALELWQEWWRDLLLARCGTSALVNVDREPAIRADAERYSLQEIESYLRAIERAIQQLDQNVSPSLVMEVLLLKAPHVSAEASQV
jgi:DNA polymerase-3 subunit delta'